MIIFQNVKFKNFLSTGNDWTEINLNKTSSTLIVGHNGAGKSTILDALSFGLFGKPHRNINKPQLVNTINNKDCVVEVQFQIGPSNFKIIRGLKPAIFEIWKNGTMINQSSKSIEYQKILEQNIIKLNHKSFHQIVVLGSSSFIPFMQLPAQHRRDVIEDLLDINIFSKMNILVKEKNGKLKDNLKDLAYQLDILNNRIETQKKYIKDITQINDEEIASKNASIKSTYEEIEVIQNQNLELTEQIGTSQESIDDSLKKAHAKKESLVQYNAQFKQTISNVVKDAKFFEDNDNCPVCTQTIQDTMRTLKIEDAKAKAKELKTAIEKVAEETRVVENTIADFNSKAEDIRKKTSTISSNNRQISFLQRSIDTLRLDIDRLSNKTGDMGVAESELSSMKEEKSRLMETRLTLNEEYTYNQVKAEMLKDTGIKTKVIKQYLPVINKLVNQYLQVLDFFVLFNLDESFQETIRSRHRDIFTYDSFSEGEKQRIDLALLFTWRQIAKMKNSVATNLLVLDETFDSSLDHEGVDNLMKILYTLDNDTNVFVISHKGEILDGKFKEKIEFYKDKNFSKIK
jgi:DNA repair exonuclease SbcCD ATPase subunit